MKDEQLFSATSYFTPARKKQNMSRTTSSVPVRLRPYLLINNIGGTEQMQHTLYKTEVVFCYQHKIISVCIISRNKSNKVFCYVLLSEGPP